MFKRTCLLVFISAATTACAAVAQAPEGPPPPPIPGAPPALPGRPGLVAGAFVPTTVNGTVKSYLLNPGGQVDGLLLADGKQLHFPPHMGAALRQAARPGDSIQATVEMGNQSVYGRECRTISLTNPKTGATVVDQPPLSPPSPPVPGQAVTAKGTIARWLVGHMGEVNGFLLSDGTQVHFPPHLGFALNQQVKVGDAVAAQGYGTRTDFGTSLDLAAMTVNGKSLSMFGSQP
ncbi:MAG: hypothetical protein P4L53_16870 [Candidatus Obscuribacterales bacterium]|nr:hypothetical protein [Candidatus Obscuribacterales bacterium]